jgi:hypothetical protein
MARATLPNLNVMKKLCSDQSKLIKHQCLSTKYLCVAVESPPAPEVLPAGVVVQVVTINTYNFVHLKLITLFIIHTIYVFQCFPHFILYEVLRTSPLRGEHALHFKVQLHFLMPRALLYLIFECPECSVAFLFECPMHYSHFFECPERYGNFVI